jgi:hypothetical protein
MQEMHLTFLEKYSDAETPMIGTLANVLNADDFMARLRQMLLEHFDTNDDDLQLSKGISEYYVAILTGSCQTGFEVKVDGVKYEIEMLRTWLY